MTMATQANVSNNDISFLERVDHRAQTNISNSGIDCYERLDRCPSNISTRSFAHDIAMNSCKRNSRITSPSKKKKVRFDETVTDQGEFKVKEHVIERQEPITNEEQEERWYSLAEFALIKKENAEIARGLQSQQLGSHALSYTKTLMRIYVSCITLEDEINPTDVLLLNKWATLAHLHRGLERHAVPTVARYSKREKIRTVQHILKLQSQLQDKTFQEREATLSDAYKILAEPSRCFVLTLAQADFVAAKHEYESFVEKMDEEEGTAQQQEKDHHDLVMSYPEIEETAPRHEEALCA